MVADLLNAISGKLAAAGLIAGLTAVLAGPATAANADIPPPGRYCDRPDYGWVCLYQHQDMSGWSVGYTHCGFNTFPLWFHDLASSYRDNQYGGAYTDVYGVADGYLFSTIPDNLHHWVPFPYNDRADYVDVIC